MNYARQIEANGSNAIVVTPDHPQSEDIHYSFPVVSYPSVEFRMMDNYMAGIPFSPEMTKTVSAQARALLESYQKTYGHPNSEDLEDLQDFVGEALSY